MQDTTNVLQGTIKVLKEGFGFLKVEWNDDVFFHANNLENVDFNELNEGDILEFEIWEGKNGKSQAVNVNIVEVTTAE